MRWLLPKHEQLFLACFIAVADTLCTFPLQQPSRQRSHILAHRLWARQYLCPQEAFYRSIIAGVSFTYVHRKSDKGVHCSGRIDVSWICSMQ